MGPATGDGELTWLLDAYDVHRPTPGDRPWLMLDMVSSVDGRIALDGRVGELSTPPDKALFLHLRALSDAVVVGAQTVRSENYGPVRSNPAAAERRAARNQAPDARLCIVSRSLQLDPTARVFDEGGPLPVIFTCESSPVERRAILAEVAHVEVIGDDFVDLTAAMRMLRGWGSELVVCEGGAMINSELVDS